MGDRFDLWLWATFSSRRYERLPEFRSDRQAFDKGEDDGPFIAVREQVEGKLKLSPSELADRKDEYVRGYHETFLPALREYWKHIPASQRYRADLDGDGRHEVVAYGELPDGWYGHHVVLILSRREGPHWKLTYIRSLDPSERSFGVTIADFDGDRVTDLAFQSRTVAGWLWMNQWVFCGKELSEPHAYTGRYARIIAEPSTNKPVFIQGWAFNASGGKASYLSGSMATEFRAIRFTSGSEPQSVSVYTNQSLW